jgi:hypothetical protein
MNVKVFSAGDFVLQTDKLFFQVHNHLIQSLGYAVMNQDAGVGI